MENRRVVVTGMGLVTPAGITLEDNWNKIISGESAIGKITCLNTSHSPVKLGGEVQEINFKKYIRIKKFFKFMRRSVQYALLASHSAMTDSKCEVEEMDKERIGLYIGGGDPGTNYDEFFPALEQSVNINGDINYRKFGIYGLKKIDPYILLHDLVNNGLCYISIEHKISGINNNFCITGISGAQAIGTGFNAIKNGDADFVIAGGYDSLFTSFPLYTMYYGMNLLTYETDPAKGMKPYSSDRDGFVLGEGAGIVILENYDHAISRNAPMYGEITGYYCNCDTNPSLLDPDPGGEALAIAIKTVLEQTGISPSAIDYINSEGNATPKNDICETIAFKKVFGDRVGAIPVSTIKPVVGNLGAAASAVDVIITLYTMEKGVIPQTLNCLKDDPLCDLDYVVHQPRKKNINHAISVNKGLCGLNSVIAMKKI